MISCPSQQEASDWEPAWRFLHIAGSVMKHIPRIKPEMREKAEEIFRTGSKLTPEEYAYYHVTRDIASGEVQCDPFTMAV